MATIIFDSTLDAELEKAVPPAFRGGRKTAIRADFVAREWLRMQREQAAQASRDRRAEPPAAA